MGRVNVDIYLADCQTETADLIGAMLHACVGMLAQA